MTVSLLFNVQLLFHLDTKCRGPVKCGGTQGGIKEICVGFEGNKVYCYGANNGCKWNQQDCKEDDDCKKYTTESDKFTDGWDVDCLKPSGWRASACKCSNEIGTYEFSVFSR